MKNLLLSLLIILGASFTSVSAKDISAYLIGEHVDVSTARKNLKSAGYTILTTYDSVKNGKTIVFTNDALMKEAAQETRAYAAVLRLFVDDQEKLISITNPVYFGRAFMQDDYNEAVFNAELEKLHGVFSALKGSSDALEDDDIAGFHFMMGMPYYEDEYELADGNNNELLNKLKATKKVLFELKISDNTTLVGYALKDETNAFVEKIGRSNAAVLPYCVSIENEKATALDAKYYLAISYPKLSMGEFMEIADVPDSILEELESAIK